jgi:hypothetical protein
MISKIRNLEFALYWSTALFTTLLLYALSYWFSGIAPPPIAEYMYEMEICGPVWTGAENLASTEIRSPDRPARSQSLYRLSYPLNNYI